MFAVMCEHAAPHSQKRDQELGGFNSQIPISCRESNEHDRDLIAKGLVSSNLVHNDKNAQHTYRQRILAPTQGGVVVDQSGEQPLMNPNRCSFKQNHRTVPTTWSVISDSESNSGSDSDNFRDSIERSRTDVNNTDSES